MTGILGPAYLAAAGTTGNNTHTSKRATPDADKTAVVFVVEVAGATPTVTYKLQGTLDGDAVSDGNANWFDLILLPSNNETAAVSATVTAVGAYTSYVSQAHSRFLRRVRVVTSANTNITYRAELHQHLKP